MAFVALITTGGIMNFSSNRNVSSIRVVSFNCMLHPVITLAHRIAETCFNEIRYIICALSTHYKTSSAASPSQTSNSTFNRGSAMGYSASRAKVGCIPLRTACEVDVLAHGRRSSNGFGEGVATTKGYDFHLHPDNLNDEGGISY